MYKGISYVQIQLKPSKIPANGNTCIYCIAYSDISLCDAICSQCKMQHVFAIKKPKYKSYMVGHAND